MTSPPDSLSTASNNSITPNLLVFINITCPGNILPSPKDLNLCVTLPLVKVISSSFVAKTLLPGLETSFILFRTGCSWGVYFSCTHRCECPPYGFSEFPWHTCCMNPKS
eukprot:NODE_135_length_18075_cov_0.518413.p15 type:complete len:109 gc:universal NODE_135_length_18075_cov_0.518413:7512-7838(+)